MVVIMKKDEIIIIYKAVGKNPELKKIKNNIQEFEQILGGKTTCIPYENIIIVCKENRKNLQPNIYINTKFLGLGETIRGDIVITTKNEQDFKTLNKEQVIENIKFLEHASFNYNHTNSKLKDKDFVRSFKRELTINREEKDFDSINIQNDETLNLILAIQTIILDFIKNKKN